MTQELRDYQRQAMDAVRAQFVASPKPHRRVVLVLPTGAGKTTVAAKIIEATLTARPAQPNLVLFQAHRTELIDQCSERLDENGLKAHGVIMAGHPRRRPHAPIQVASVQTLSNRKLLDPPPRLIIADECHRVLGRQQLRIVSELYPTAHVIGLTATPWRLDGRGLGQFDADGQAQLFSAMVQGATYAELIEQGHILDPAVCCPWTPDLSAVGVGADGEYDADEIAELVDRPQTIKDIVDQWHERAGGARTVVFAASIEHSQHIVAAFKDAGVAAEHLDGTTDKDLRREILKRVRSGETRVVSNYNVLGEGWDCPAVEVCILARPTASLSLFMQCVGRVLRPALASGKVRALVLDFAGCVLRHGWPTADRPWSLADRPRKKKGGGAADEDQAPPVAQCPKCLFARPSSKASQPCGNCGYLDPDVKVSTAPSGNSGVPMVEVTRAAVEACVEPPRPAPSMAARSIFSRPPGAPGTRPVQTRPVYQGGRR